MTAQPPPLVPVHRDPDQDKGQSPTPQGGGLPPLKPRPKLFVALCVLLVCWLAAIIAMRFTTVHRDPVPAVPQLPSR